MGFNLHWSLVSSIVPSWVLGMNLFLSVSPSLEPVTEKYHEAINLIGGFKPVRTE